MPAPVEPVTGITFKLTTNIKEIVGMIELGAIAGLNRIAIRWHGKAREAAPVDTGRLRSSITFSTPTVRKRVRVAATAGQQGYLFDPPPVDGLEVVIGSNVEYAPAVHEGVTWAGGPVEVKAHKRRQTKAWGHPINPPKVVNVAPHTRIVGPVNRPPNKFIEGPGRELLPVFQRMMDEEIAKATGDQ